METDYDLRSKKEKEKEGNYGKLEKQNWDIEVKKNVKKNKDGKIYVATWNVRGTYTEGALIRLTQIMSNYAIDIMAIQETKQKENFTQEIGNYIYFNSGADDRIFGVFEEKEEEEKEEFYERIEGVYNKIPRYDVKMVIGDFNAKIGKEEIYKPIIGSHSKHNQSNENGKKLIEFATEKDLRIVTTFFQHKNIHKGTWTSPNGKTVNQIDHVTIESKHINYVLDARSYRGADLDTDHMLVKATLKYRKPTIGQKKGKVNSKYDVEKLKEKEIVNEFQRRIKREITGSDVEEKWQEFEQIMADGAQILKNDENNVKSKSWFNEECKEAILKREKAKMVFIKNNTTNNREHYDKCRKEAKVVCRKKKREHIEK
ncbi:craniofacial development protein 2-like [Anoplophora glabripennis]|uniref:craniofacial development protein 2-like n=1 Tax=Anoplophora glabripennis TaxID=217634 RepID=UPI000C7614F9|nr:craniofacial development protein 2-like [Anoplophora glabripennis]